MKRIQTTAAVIAALLCGAALAPAQVVISQVYGAGGNANALMRNDYVELFNKGAAPVSLTGYSLQYASTVGTSWTNSLALSGTIQANKYFLVQLASGGSAGTVLPTPDQTGTINMAAGAGKIVLLSSTTAPTAGTVCPTTNVVDIVGYGSGTNCFEGSGPTATISISLAAFRGSGGCTDTNSNSADFATGAPAPRNSASPANVCGVVGGLSITSSSPLPSGTVNTPYTTFTFAATGGAGGNAWTIDSGAFPTGLMLATNGNLTGTPTQTGTFSNIVVRVTDSAFATTTATFSITINAAPTCTPTHLISQVQGSGSTSPVAGQTITTSGIVTGRKSNGFFIQSAPGTEDADPNTSEGVFVFTSSAPLSVAALGSLVCVTGQVQEFAPDPNGPTTTEIALSPTYFAISTGNPLPAPITITAADLPTVGPLDPLEKYEGMRVQIASLTVIAPTQGTISEANATSSSNGVFYAVVTGVPRPVREPGVQVGIPLPAGAPANVPRFDFNPERLRVDSDAIGASALEVSSGVTITNVVGIVDYGFYTTTLDIQSSDAPSANGSASPAAAPLAEELTVAAANLERFFDTTDDQGISDIALTQTAFANRLNKASLGIRNTLNFPDILAVEEVENLTTLQALAGKINNDAVAASQPNPQYVAFLSEGNDIGGIDVGFLVKSVKVNVVEVVQLGQTATFIDPGTGQPALIFDRPPLLLRATASRPGATATLPITVLALHLRSLNGVEDVADSRVREKRRAGAEFVANLIQARQIASPTENIVVVGDFNAFEFNDGYVDVTNTIRGVPAPADTVVSASPALVNPTLTNVLPLAPAGRRYSYIFDGDTQFIDQILVNQPLMTKFNRSDIAHTNADFPESFRNDPNRPERLTDHDWPIAYFTMPADAGATDITSQVSLTSTGFLYSRVTQTYSATVTLTNTSGSPITGAIQFVLSNLLPAGASVVNPTGTSPFGPYITAQASGTLAPGAFIKIPLQISAPPATTITYTRKAYLGGF